MAKKLKVTCKKSVVSGYSGSYNTLNSSPGEDPKDCNVSSGNLLLLGNVFTVLINLIQKSARMQNRKIGNCEFSLPHLSKAINFFGRLRLIGLWLYESHFSMQPVI